MPLKKHIFLGLNTWNSFCCINKDLKPDNCEFMFLLCWSFPSFLPFPFFFFLSSVILRKSWLPVKFDSSWGQKQQTTQHLQHQHIITCCLLYPISRNSLLLPTVISSFTSLHFTSLHFTSLHFISFHFPSLPFSSLLLLCTSVLAANRTLRLYFVYLINWMENGHGFDVTSTGVVATDR